MKIIHVLNNSAVICKDESQKEVIAIGKGIAFGKKEGNEVKKSEADKIFVNDNKQSSELIDLLNRIPNEYFDISTVIIRYANKKLDSKLNSSIFLALPDHIDGMMYRYQNDIYLPFSFLAEVKIFYPKEFHVAEWAYDYICADLNIDLKRDEIGFLAIDFINASGIENGMKQLKQVMSIVKMIDDQITDNIAVVDKQSLNYSRFLTHLRYFALRYISNKQHEADKVKINFDSNFLKEMRPLIDQINTTLVEKFGRKMDSTEEKYILLHLQRLIISTNKN